MAYVLIFAKSQEELVRRLKDVESSSLNSSLEVGGGEYKAAFSFFKKTDALPKITELIRAASLDQELIKPNEGLYTTRRAFTDEQLAFVFPGQGSQQKQMLKKFLSEKEFEESLQHLSEYALKNHKTDLQSLLYDDSSDLDINQTQWTQPALGLVCSSLYKLMLKKGLRPSMFAGHSFGEIVALHASGCFDEKELLAIAFERGRLMASANELVPGKMLAVVDKSAQSYLDLINKVSAYLSRGQCELANINNHNQIVLSGSIASIENVKRIAEEMGLRSTTLLASAAFHSSLMKPIQQQFQNFLTQRSDHFNDPKKFVASNIEGATYNRIQNIILNLSSQLASQVNWVSTVSRLYQNGARVFVEVGPKNILSKLIDDILPEKECYTISLDGPVALENQLLFFKVLGLSVDLREQGETLADTTQLGSGISKIQTENKIVSFFLSKQKDLLSQAESLNDPALKKRVVEKIVSDTELVVTKYFETKLPHTSLSSPSEKTDLPEDENIRFVKELISRITGFENHEISLEKNLEYDLMLDSITKMDLFASLSQRYKNQINDVESLFALKTVGDIVHFLQSLDIGLNSEKDMLTIEQLWLRDEIAALTGFSPSEITTKLDFSSDLMLDSIMKAELFSSFSKEFPEYHLNDLQMSSIQSLEKLKTQLEATHVKKMTTDQTKTDESESKRDPKKFSVSFRNALSKYLQKPLEEIHSNSHFELDLNLTIFEKEEILNSLILEYPYVQIAGRALLNAQTVGQVIEIERGVDKRSRERDEEKIERYHFEQILVERHPTQKAQFVRPITFMPILCDAKGSHIEKYLQKMVKVVSGSIELEEDIEPALQTLASSLNQESHDLLFLFQSHSQHYSDYSRSLRLIHGLGQKLLDLSQKFSHLKVKIIFDPGENFYLKGLASFFRSLVRETNLSVNLLEMNWSDVPAQDIPWDVLWSQNEDEGTCQSYRMICSRIYQEKLSSSSFDLNKKLSLDLPDQLKVLIMGGGRGITSEISKYFASQHSAEIYAVGRTQMPPEHPYKDIKSNRELREHLWQKFKRLDVKSAQEEQTKEFNSYYDRILKERELWSTKESVEQRGGKFIYLSADLSNIEDCQRILEHIEKVSGGIQGVIHAPGLILDNLLSRKKYQDFNLVVRTKADSAYVLYQFYKNKKLYFAKLLSSLSSWSGAPGQTDYALANEVINRLAQDWNQESDYPVSSLLWSVWSETGLASNSLIQQMKKLNLGLITNLAGVRLFQDDLLYSTGQFDKVMFSPKSTLDFSLKVKNHEV